MTEPSTPAALQGESLPAAREHRPRGTPRASRRSPWRATALVLLHVALLVHIAHWRVARSTLSPLEPSEAMQTLELGYVNAGFVLLLVSTLATLIFGRFFCGWACHVVAYQDAAAWLLGKLSLRPRPIRSRLLAWVPFAAAFYMFAWPTLARWLEGRELAGFRAHFTTQDFWATFPGPAVAALTFAVDGFLIVWLLGAKGFCTYGCPYGAIFGLADRASRGRIRVTDACEGCGHCTATCTSNVLVHAEVARFGQVVDPGCMKCMDCVSVCPKEALYFGFGESRGAALARAGAKSPKRVLDFSAGEEVALALAFLATLFAVRGLYGLVPFLLALGVSVISALAAVLAWRVLRRPRVVFQRRALVEAGKRSALGWAALAACAPWFLFVGHSGWVQAHTARGHWLLADAAALPLAERGPTLAKGLAHLDRAAQLGLLPVADLEFQRGQILARQGDAAGAQARLARALELDPELALARVELAELALRAVPPDPGGARRELELALAADPGRPRARELLATVELQDAQAVRASDPAACERHLRRALDLLPHFAPAALDLSDLLMSRAPPDVAGARAALRAVLPADPSHAEAARRLALLSERFGPEPAR